MVSVEGERGTGHWPNWATPFLPLLLGEVESLKSKRRRISTLAKTGGYLRAIAKRRPNGI